MWKTEYISRFKAFTLIELLVSIGVLAIISAGLYSLIGQGPRQAARDARRQADLEMVKSALTVYRNDNGTYPRCVGSTNGCIETNITNGVGMPAFNTYLSAGVPSDPVTGRRYIYAPLPAFCAGTTASRCTGFELCAGSEKGGTSHDCGSSGWSCGGTNPCVFWVRNE